MRDASGNIVAIYDQDLNQKEIPLYGSGRLGVRLVETDDTFSKNVFEFKDHLGSVRARAYWQGASLTTDQWRDYYPYGLQMDSNKEGKDTRFGYQGDFAEEDGETNFNFFEARVFDPVIGRWMVVDPARQFASGYVGMGNNPVNGVGPDGEDWYYYFDEGGYSRVMFDRELTGHQEGLFYLTDNKASIFEVAAVLDWHGDRGNAGNVLANEFVRGWLEGSANGILYAVGVGTVILDGVQSAFTDRSYLYAESIKFGKYEFAVGYNQITIDREFSNFYIESRRLEGLEDGSAALNSALTFVGLGGKGKPFLNLASPSFLINPFTPKGIVDYTFEGVKMGAHQVITETDWKHNYNEMKNYSFNE
ncbi:RHS repeat-associated core domain-containing protein [Persicobacter psychrovividus]|uniref:RHS repeat-associated core domain-containing protein n=1 Tax=Persicobacter psychrovividus TaxID=387638 RepID=A0ABN6L6G9_9BACT|nr:hypothetical protein PEPS_10380 [Persicobacter psychrovividus]